MASASRALVLGGTGFLGGHIARAWAASGRPVRVLCRSWSSQLALEGVEAEIVHGDLRDRASLEAAMAGCDVVFHAAGFYPRTTLTPRADRRRGVTEIRDVLGAAASAGVGRVVYTSTLSTIGRPPAGGPDRAADEGDRYTPGSVGDAYFEIKYAMEAEALRADRPTGAGPEVVVTNPAVVLGPGDVTPTSGAMMLLVARTPVMAHFGGVLATIDARDVAAAHLAAADRGRPGERYILAGPARPVGELLAAMAASLGRRVRLVRVPARAVEAASLASEAAHLASGRRLGFLPHEFVAMVREGQPLDATRARTELSLRADRPLDETLADEAAWFRTHGYLA